MISATATLRVRYSEVDSMKYVYYGNYAEYFEIGRVELLRSLGLPYSGLEERGIWLPVSEFRIKYLRPAFYDDILYIHTRIPKKPSVKIEFEYEIFNQENEKITEAQTTLFFFSSEKKKIIRCPQFIFDVIEENWGKDFTL